MDRGRIAAICVVLVLGAIVFEQQLRNHLWNFKHSVWVSTHAARVGQPWPALKLTTLQGSDATLKAHRGRAMLVNVFTTWCPPCLAEMPALIEVAPKLEKQGVDVIGIDQQEPASRVLSFIALNRVPYPVVIDQTNVSNALLDARIIPTTLVIGADGKLRSICHGPMSASQFMRAASEVHQ